MKYQLVIKDPKNQPTHGSYRDWKEQIAEECYYRCVYCSIHEGQFGGINNFQIDHFRPKSKFNYLENNILNLFYACPICNRFKSNDWPADPDLNTISYPDPSQVNYSDLFYIDHDFRLSGKTVSSKYVVQRLFLNRAQLVIERRENFSLRKAKLLIFELSALIDQLCETDPKEAYAALKELDEVKNTMLALNEKRRTTRPYSLCQIRKSEE